MYGGLDNPKLTYSGKVNLRAGVNKISLLSVSVGLPVSGTSFSYSLSHINVATLSETRGLTTLVLCLTSQNVGVHYERWNEGVLGPVTLKGLNAGTRDLTKQRWSYKVRYY